MRVRLRSLYKVTNSLISYISNRFQNIIGFKSEEREEREYFDPESYESTPKVGINILEGEDSQESFERLDNQGMAQKIETRIKAGIKMEEEVAKIENLKSDLPPEPNNENLMSNETSKARRLIFKSLTLTEKSLGALSKEVLGRKFKVKAHHSNLKKSSILWKNPKVLPNFYPKNRPLTPVRPEIKINEIDYSEQNRFTSQEVLQSLESEFRDFKDEEENTSRNKKI